MHRQSDYGYSVPQAEQRSAALCLQRARMCLAASRRDPDACPYYASNLTHRDAAREWVREAKIYRAWERRQQAA